jgi:hypothetical protein
VRENAKVFITSTPALLARNLSAFLLRNLFRHLADHLAALWHGDGLADLSRDLSDHLGADELRDVGADLSRHLFGHLTRNLVALGPLDLLAALRVINHET